MREDSNHCSFFLGMHYDDFFKPPTKDLLQRLKKQGKFKKPNPVQKMKVKNRTEEATPTESSSRKVRFSEKVKVKPIPQSGKSRSLNDSSEEEYDDDEDEELDADDRKLSQMLAMDAEEEEDGSEALSDEDLMAEADSQDDGEDEEDDDMSDEEQMDKDHDVSVRSMVSSNHIHNDRMTARRASRSLFDEKEELDNTNLSNHERRQARIAAQIKELENENVGPKDWTLLGEARSKARPKDSLLENDLEFDVTAKVVPAMTEERIISIEDLIKKRILDVSAYGFKRWPSADLPV